MLPKHRPIFTRLSDDERAEFDKYCSTVTVKYSVVVRAMIKDCLNRIKKGEKLDLMLGVASRMEPAE